jgi:hypothetical protein
VSFAKAADAGAWDTFVADVAITSTRLTAMKGLPPTMPQVAYHLERSLQANGNWRSVMTIDRSAKALALGSNLKAKLPQTTVARIEDDADGTPPRMYNADGVEIQRGTLPAVPSTMHPDAAFQSA